MIQRDPYISELVTRLNSLSCERGMMLLWTEFEQATGLSRHNPKFKSAMRRYRKDLLETRGIALFPEHGIGLRALLPDEQVHIPAKTRTRRMRRQADRAIREIGATDVAQLSEIDSRLRCAFLDRFEQQKKAIVLRSWMSPPSSSLPLHSEVIVTS